ncbi:hypothetical protein [Frigoriglobus tundricola]|uniref:Uncharacterized protein n=1 Tax=Frigoriglobus tundricola TaxID=2774151 RepID=A0A6M5Z1D6_9BACT|nr:hypothetical protein [Frigoriglobus tundricola]QJW99221.1 hypothetical protein FTUN_6823 [Frigoriglobus tundricola]
MIASIVVAVVLVVVPASAPPGAVEVPETRIKLTVDPTPAPKPALRYLLLPEMRELTQGNPIPHYMKAVLEHESTSQAETMNRAALKQVDRAARMDKPDWQLLPKMKTDGFGLLLPDLQKMRFLATSLQGRFRDEIALRQFDAAVGTAKTLFALARHTGDHPTLIGTLVGIAIASVAIAPFEEMLEQPGCPNFYWALTNLPTPFITMEKAADGERVLVLSDLFRDLDDKNPMTTAQLKKVIAYIDRLRGLSDRELKTVAWLSGHAKDETYMEAARHRLIDSGIPAERLAGFSTYQVILLNERIEFEVQQDEALKLFNLSTWESLALLDAMPNQKGRALFADFLSAYGRVRRAQGRLEQRIALLRHVEALRLYAAAHAGKLPEKLADVGVPLPADPFTGKPVRYELVDGVAHLRGSPPKGEEQTPAYNLHYEITIRK